MRPVVMRPDSMMHTPRHSGRQVVWDAELTSPVLTMTTQHSRAARMSRSPEHSDLQIGDFENHCSANGGQLKIAGRQTITRYSWLY